MADNGGVLSTVMPLRVRNDSVGSGGLVHTSSATLKFAFQQLIPQSMSVSPRWVTVIVKG